MIEILFALVFAGSGEPDCIIFDDGVRTHEEIMEACREFAEGYVWEPPVYAEPVTECWTQWQFGLVDDCPVGGSGASYVVRDGDLSLWSISQKYGIPFGALLDANPSSPDLIRVGDRINLP